VYKFFFLSSFLFLPFFNVQGSDEQTQGNSQGNPMQAIGQVYQKFMGLIGAGQNRGSSQTVAPDYSAQNPDLPKVPTEQLSASQASKAAMDACLKTGTSADLCAALNQSTDSGQTATTSHAVSTTNSPPSPPLSGDNLFFSKIKTEIANAKENETVSYLDLNFSDFMVLSFFQMIFMQMDGLSNVGNTVSLLDLITDNPAPGSSLSSKSVLFKSISKTLLSWETLHDSVNGRFPSIAFSWDDYTNIENSFNISAPQKGGVILIFTDQTTSKTRFRLISHPDIGFFKDFYTQMSAQTAKDIGLSLPSA
jgi:hypothetical protein